MVTGQTPSGRDTPPPRRNGLLAALPGADSEHVLPHLEPFPLNLGRAIYESGGHQGYVYFPTDSIVSLLYVMEDGGYRFTGLKIASGALAADGNVSISARKELSGRINAQIKAAGTSANVPLNVAGTLDSPLLYPTAGTVAGAAVGTAILGPGLGTSVGAKVGGWAENLFGKKEKKTPKK